jgi:hypothetical protein
MATQKQNPHVECFVHKMQKIKDCISIDVVSIQMS